MADSINWKETMVSIPALLQTYRKLFEEGDLQFIDPKRIAVDGRGKVQIGSLYYRTLKLMEQFAQRQPLLSPFVQKDEFKKAQELFMRKLLENYFVPNYNLLLNDRVRTLVGREGILDFPRALDGLVEKVIRTQEQMIAQERIAFVGEQKENARNDYVAYLGRVMQAATSLQHALFLMRPRVVSAPPDATMLLTLHERCQQMLSLVDRMDKGNAYGHSVQSFLQALDVVEKNMCDVQEISEEPFYYKNRSYHSTKWFARRWGSMSDDVGFLQMVFENPYQKKKGKMAFSFPAIPFPSGGYKNAMKAGAYTLATVIVLGAASIPFPEMRYGVGLPTTAKERFAVLYEKGLKDDAEKALKGIEKTEENGLFVFETVFGKYFEGNEGFPPCSYGAYEVLKGDISRFTKRFTVSGERVTESALRHGFLFLEGKYREQSKAASSEEYARMYFTQLLQKGWGVLGETDKKIKADLKDAIAFYAGYNKIDILFCIINYGKNEAQLYKVVENKGGELTAEAK